eukprot:TRINITY_DN12518_c0_g1_i1.p2 TRINITY_DN12518_c0_g1~~TRINITY_DN12518_c0_g1_i1.p2  ORF type:complete len:314 (+),score=95.25 TRINITY_DN12518_c0_g1_i1:60-1001(+)
MAVVYLAGPDVFRADALGIAAKKKAICQEYGLVGKFPLDNCLSLDGMAPRDAALAIAEANEALMRSADGCIANMTPFRGASMDVGTAFEMGFMRAQGKPVHGYTQTAASFSERTAEWAKAQGKELRDRPGPRKAREDGDGNEVEDFGAMTDNLMLDNAVQSSVGARPEIGTETGHEMGTDAALAPFRRCCAALAKELKMKAIEAEEAMSPTSGSRAGLVFISREDELAACFALAGERVVVVHEYREEPALQFRSEAKKQPDVVFALHRRPDAPEAGSISFRIRGAEVGERIDCSVGAAAVRDAMHDTITRLDE